MRKLHRSRRSRMLGGVAAGLADYFGIDITVMRLLFALIAVTIPNVILAYVLAWIIIPEEPTDKAAAPGQTATTTRGDPSVDEKPGEAGNLPPTAEELLGSKPEALQPSREAAKPPAPSQATAGTGTPGSSGNASCPDRNKQLFGYILVFVGVVALARKFLPAVVWRLPARLMGQFWPALVIVVGVVLILGAIRGR